MTSSSISPTFILKKLKALLIDRGIAPGDSFSKTRAIRLSNLIALTAIWNTIFFTLFCVWFQDPTLVVLGCCIILLYSFSYACNLLGFTLFGRTSILISGNLVIFYLANLFRGASDLELLFFSLAVCPFMFFSWEEKAGYLLGLLSISLFVVGELQGWTYFGPLDKDYELLPVRIFAILGTSHQIIAGYYYFLKQNIDYEAKLALEHQRQIQYQKMSSLGEMAAGMSHEINNPFMVIVSRTHLLKSELSASYPTDTGLQDHLQKIEEMVRRISKIIQSLNNFSRITDSDPFQVVDLNGIIEETLDLCHKRLSSKGIELSVQVEDGLALMCRPTEISQVLLNLLNNAYDALSGRRDGTVFIRVGRRGNWVEILVSDNGIGVPASIQHRIMEPFFTTKGIGKGTGLGLSISKGLVEAHSGELNFLQGQELTTFQILLPLTDPLSSPLPTRS